MNIVVIGTGYVGLVTGTCLSELGNKVICIDKDALKIKTLKKGRSPIYEPGLEELIQRNFKEGRLFFDTSLKSVIKEAELVFIAVGTPSRLNGSADMSYVQVAAKEVGQLLDHYVVVINKSTVPVGSGQMVKNIIKKYYKGEFDIVSCPEFLREGSAVDDFMNPDRVVVGNSSDRAKKIMEEVFKPLNTPILFTDIETAELIKYASNSFLATQISFINNLSNLTEKVGGDIIKIAEGMRLDKRIGKHAFLNAGVGYGGSCFPKDVKALIYTAKSNKIPFSILDEVERVNYNQRKNLIKKIKLLLPKIKNAKISIWGLAFKPKTDDVREAPALMIIKELLKAGAKLKAFDPVAEHNFKALISNKNIQYCPNPFEAVKGSDLLVIMTDWDEFKEIDKAELKNLLIKPNIIDGRNIYDPVEMKDLGFNYLGVGR